MELTIRQKIRDYYQNVTGRIEPYFMNWDELFTPIERKVWSEIRELGLPFFPQYPVSWYFLDFADPVKKIGIEVDGKQYHSSEEDLVRDSKRERELRKLGWTIYRIAGKATTLEEDRDEYGNVLSPSFRILESLKKELYYSVGQ